MTYPRFCSVALNITAVFDDGILTCGCTPSGTAVGQFFPALPFNAFCERNDSGDILARHELE
jgi:hypothetical protein